MADSFTGRKRLRTLIDISVFWLGLSLLSDGVTTLVLPNLLLKLKPDGGQATVLGLLTFLGLLVGMLVQPYAGAWSDRLRPCLGRRGPIGCLPPKPSGVGAPPGP